MSEENKDNTVENEEPKTEKRGWAFSQGAGGRRIRRLCHFDTRLALLTNIFERKQEARNPFFRVVELTDDTHDPAVWGKNFPPQYDSYLRTVDQVRTRFGGSEAVHKAPTNADPRRSSPNHGSKKTRG